MGTDKGVASDHMPSAVVFATCTRQVALKLNLIPHLFSNPDMCFECGKKAKMKSNMQLLHVCIYLIHY